MYVKIEFCVRVFHSFPDEFPRIIKTTDICVSDDIATF